MFDWLSLVTGFLVGAATGATGSYLATRFTDQRRDREARRAARERFERTCSKVPELIAEMRSDLTQPDNASVREFVVLRDSRTGFNSSRRRFRYHEDEHSDLLGQITVLENEGYVEDVTVGQTPIYRFSEGFVETLLRMAPNTA